MATERAEHLDDDDDQLALWPELAPELPRCDMCAALLDRRARADARYCSTTCRVRAHRRRRR